VIVTLDDVKAQLNQALDIDDDLIGRKIAAAQNHVENLIGFKIEEQYTPSKIPPALRECVMLLAAHWYENREASLVGVNAQALPFGLLDIVNEFRCWSFGEEGADA
jgi:uncharacterized phage protein (predicted DNA packaging)